MNKTFDNVSASTFQCLGGKLQEQGLSFEGTSGYLSKNGISTDYHFDESNQTLSITNLEVGFPASLVGMNTEKVMGILEKAIDECR
ncbi:hypothetical protein [Roseivirga misakiensis]|uniref:Uncharacterized protein n=1 Tax=Roseivirga misakiensis TaxID=1563681 RepID=A0A1E5SKY3_9BACT|nr:hypothetical protein [Roseivirga misakiensis]OEJ99706.1 hypothetical protein BFP71_09050 [Roseivirga misakiensis]